jgi:hypothetical protein
MKKIAPFLPILSLSITTVAMMTLSATSAQAVNLFTNGNFETGNFSSWALSTNNDVFVSDGDNGTKTAFLGTISIESLSQTLVTVAGTSYQIKYDLLSGGGTPNSFEARVNNTVLFSQANIAATAPFFTPYSFTYTGTGADKLEFRFSDAGTYFQLDNVQFNGLAAATAVPEPMMTIGTLIGGSVVLRLRKKLRSQQTSK